MARFEKQYWIADGSGVTRRDRRSCEYATYIPDELVGRSFTLEGDVAADAADAEAAIIRLNTEVAALVNTEAIARLLLRAEAVASSRIEGLRIGAGRLLRHEAARDFGTFGRSDVTAQEVLANVDAMAQALADANAEERVTVDSIMRIHARLLAGTDLDEHAGRVRTVQNWIGGNSFNPCGASFVPPQPEHVVRLLADLAEFCSDDSLPAVVQAAIAHAQFETIHPFVDGNGRTGRALIHVILRRRGLAPRVVPPVSLVLATLSADYVQALTGYRYDGEPDSESAMRGANQWIALFAGSCTRAVRDAGAFEARIKSIQAEWRARLGPVRSDSGASRLIDALPGTPVLTVTGAARLLDRSFRAANGAIEALTEAGVLTQSSAGQRNRTFEAPDVIEVFTDLERQLASREGDTRTSPPERPAPARRG